MTAISPESQPGPELSDRSDRMLHARMGMIAATLPFTILANPLWVAFVAPFAFGGLFPQLGVVPPAEIGGLIGLHLVNSFYAWVLLRAWRRKWLGLEALHAHLVALQALVSLAWAAGIWVTWADHNAVNNIFEALSLAIVLWGVTLTRAADTAVFCAGLVPMVTAFLLRAALATDQISLLFIVVGPACAIYAAFSGIAARRRIDELLQIRFAQADMAEALARSRDEAMEQHREAELANASKAAFLANMSHELRTPLNAILGFSEVISSESVGPGVSEAYRAYAGHIHASGTHLLAIVNDILDVAKIDAGKMELQPERLDPRGVLAAAALLIEANAQAKNQSLTLSVEPAVGCIVADRRAFKQIVVNLLSNAVKFSPEGGQIAVRLSVGPAGSFRLEVSDNGPGIPAEKLETILEPFARVDNRYDRAAGGTGLGLTLVDALVRLHGGRLFLRNNPGGGLTAAAEFVPGSVEVAKTEAVA